MSISSHFWKSNFFLTFLSHFSKRERSLILITYGNQKNLARFVRNNKKKTEKKMIQK